METAIFISRKWFTTKSTIGVLTIPNAGFECYTLESVARPIGVKIFGETCIPAGKYKFELAMSGRFKTVTPILYNQDGYILNDYYGCSFIGVRIFGLNNTNEETSSCIQLGYKKGENQLYESKKAFNDFMEALINNCDINKVNYIHIINNQNSIL